MNSKKSGISSERSFNKSIICCRKNKNIEYPRKIRLDSFFNFTLNFDFEISDYWNSEKSMILDVISDYILCRFYLSDSITVPQSPYNVNPSYILTKKEFEDFNDDSHPYIIQESILKSKYTFLKKYSSSKLYNLIKSVSDTKIRFNEYPVRTIHKFGNKSTFPFINYISNSMENIFSLQVIDEKKKNIEIIERIYKVNFESTLGRLFFRNLTSINIDWVNKDLYKLNKGSQLLFKTIVLPIKQKQINVRLDYISEKLDITMNSSSTHLVTIRSYLEELKNNNFILDYEEYRTGRLSFVKIEKKI